MSESESLLIKNANVVRPEGTSQKDVLVRDSRIAAIGESIDEGADTTIEARGLHLLPGIIDPQVHFRFPGQTWKEDWETGSRAAVSGGVTTVFDMPNNQPAITTRALMLEKKQAIARASHVNYNCFIGATPDNLEELNAVENVCGIKIFMGSSTGDLLVDRLSDQERIFANGTRLIAVHAEDNAVIHANQQKYSGATNFDAHRLIRSVEAALKATQQAMMLARKYKRRLHILHMTTAEEAELLVRYRESNITAEVTPQHLLLAAPEAYKRLGSRAQMNPPIREQRHGRALWQALLKGGIQCIATDHAPHTLEEKDRPFGDAPSGMPGVETSLPLMLNQVALGRCSIEHVCAWMSENPARCYAVEGKGRIEAGADADLVLVDLAKKQAVEGSRLQTKVRWSPFEGMTLQGWPVFTIVMGNVAMREGVINAEVRGREAVIGNQGALKFYG